MKSLNNRYKIKSKLGESPNSIVYKAYDEIYQKEVAIKILKENNKKLLTLFKKEYLINQRLQHPNIRKALFFEKILFIDNNRITSNRYFQVLEFVENTFKNIKVKNNKDKIKYYNQLINALKFIYTNDLHHGDIKANNILLTSDKTIKISDISPFIEVDKNQKVDIKKINKVLNQKNIHLKKNINSIDDYFNSSLFDKNQYIKIVYKHLKQSQFPLEYILSKDKIKNIVSSKNIINFYNPSSIRNCNYFLKRIYQYYEINDFQWIYLDDYEPNKNFTIIKELIKKSLKFDYLKKIIFKYGNEFVKIYKKLPFNPSEKLSDEKSENTKLINLSITLIEEIAKKTKFLIIINNYDSIDKYSKIFLNNLKPLIDEEKIKIILSNQTVIKNEYFENIQIGNLSFNIFKNHHYYFFYYYKFSDNLLKQIYQITNGEIYLLSSGIDNLLSHKAFIIKNGKLETKQKLEYYFDYTKYLKKIYTSLNNKERDILKIFKIFNNYFSKKILKKESKTFKNCFNTLKEKNILIEYSNYYFVRYNYILDLLDENIPEDLLKKQGKIINKFFDKEGFFVALYQNIAFLLTEYQKSFCTIFNYFSNLDNSNKNYDKSRFFDIFKKYKKYEHKLSKKNKFNLNWAIYKTDINNKYKKASLINKMEKNITSKKQEYYWLAYKIRNTKTMTLEDLKSHYHFFKKDIMYTNYKFNSLLLSILTKLNELGYNKETLKLFDKYILKKIESLSNIQKFNFYNNYLITNLDINNLEEAEEVGNKILKVNKKSNNLSKENEFKAFNNTAIVKLRKGNYNEALKYFRKAEKTVKNVNNYDLLSTVTLNIGVINFYQNNFSEYEKYMNKALEYSLKINDYNTIFISISNSIEYYISQLNFKKINKMLKIGDKYLNNIQSRVRKNNFLLNKIHYNLYLNKYNDVKKLFDKIKKYYLEINPSLENSFTYHVLYTVFLFLNKSRCDDYIETILNNPEFKTSEKGIYYYLSQLIINLFEFNYPEEKLNLLVNKLYENYSQEYENDNILNKNLLNFIFKYFEIDNFAKTKIFHKNKKLLKHRLFYRFTILQNKKNTSGNTIIETVLKYNLILKKIKNSMSNTEFSYFKKGNFYDKYFNIKYNNNKILDISVKELYNKYSSKESHLINKKRDKYIDKAHFKKFTTKSEIINNFINDARKLTGMQRGIYYEYSIRNGWEKIKEIFDKKNYFTGEPVNKTLLDNVILSQNDEMKIWENSNPEENDITKAIALPIIDLNISRRINFKEERSTPTRNLIDLKGFFYLDTKCNLYQPSKEDLNHSYYLREFTNVYFQNLFLINSTMKDNLTKLYKRDVWISLTANLLKKSKKENKFVGIIIADIDNFKEINDRYGHPKGDIVLKNISKLLTEQLRDIDNICRYGGEEFAFSILTKKKDDVKDVSDRIRQKVSKTTLIKDRKITISMGISIYPKNGTFLNELIEKADKALLKAKNEGKNKVILWENMDQTKEYLTNKQNIIDDPIRDSDKLNLIFSLPTKINYNNNYYKVIKDINNELLLKLHEGKLILFFTDKNTIKTTDNKYIIKDKEELKDKLDNNTFLISKLTLPKYNSKKLFLYLNIDNIEFIKHKPYYKYLGKIILEKLILYSQLS